MKLNRREGKFLCDLGVLDRAGSIERETLNAFSHIAARGNGRATAKCLELDVADYPVFVHSDLKFHNVTTTNIGCR